MVWTADISSRSMICSYISSWYIETSVVITWLMCVAGLLSVCLFVCLIFRYFVRSFVPCVNLYTKWRCAWREKCVYISHTKCNPRNVKRKLLVDLKWWFIDLCITRNVYHEAKFISWPPHNLAGIVLETNQIYSITTEERRRKFSDHDSDVSNLTPRSSHRRYFTMI